MSELIATAPLYAKTRVHFTKIGNILCTGKGCIGCDRKFHASEDEELSQILGEVDSVDFNKQEPRFLPNSDELAYHEDKARWYGNTFPARRILMGTKKKPRKTKLQSIRKLGVEQGSVKINSPRTALKERINKPDLSGFRDSKDLSNRQPEGDFLSSGKFKQKTQEKSKTVTFAAPLVRQSTFTVGEERRRFKISDIKPEKGTLKSIQLSGNRQGSIIHARSKTYPFIAEKRTNFLKMLQNSNVGIFDIEAMQTKKSSKWVEEALKSGAKEEDIFPLIHSKKQTRAVKKISENKTALARKDPQEQNNKKPPTETSERDCLAYGENKSVLVIEHAYKRVKEDDSLHKLGFRSQQGQRHKSFPRVSILEIAESLDDLVQLGVVKLIQEVQGRWFILVSSRIIRDLLILKGVTLRGRTFELTDLDVAAK